MSRQEQEMINMEIRTIGNSSAGVRPAVDSAVVLQSTQNMPSTQVSVQTARAVPQASGMELMVATRKYAGVREARHTVNADSGRRARTAPMDDAEKQAEMERVQQAVDEIAESLGNQGRLRLAVDEDLGRVIVKVVDPETEETIKQIPSEDAMALAKSIGRMRGMFVNAKA
jgi:uncharacterized FlaG/YvyC family protein